MPAIKFNPDKRIMAIDPGGACGWAFSDGQHGTWNIKQAPDLFRKLDEFNKVFPILALGVEQAMGGAFGKRKGTGGGQGNFQAAKKLAEYTAAVKMFGSLNNIPVYECNIKTVKKQWTNNGNASKEQMMTACERLLGYAPSTYDEADALAILNLIDSGWRPAVKVPKRVQRREDIKRQPRLFK